MTKIDARETTKRSLKKYTSEQILKKLQGGKFLSLSKELAVEILNDRDVELPEGFNSDEKAKPKAVPTPAHLVGIAEVAAEAEAEAMAKTKPKVNAITKNSGTRTVSNENPNIGVGMKVSFEQRVSKKTVFGKIISFYDWTTKKEVVKEAANISVEIDGKSKKFVKNVSAISLAS